MFMFLVGGMRFGTEGGAVMMMFERFAMIPAVYCFVYSPMKQKRETGADRKTFGSFFCGVFSLHAERGSNLHYRRCPFSFPSLPFDIPIGLADRLFKYIGHRPHGSIEYSDDWRGTDPVRKEGQYGLVIYSAFVGYLVKSTNPIFPNGRQQSVG